MESLQRHMNLVSATSNIPGIQGQCHFQPVASNDRLASNCGPSTTPHSTRLHLTVLLAYIYCLDQRSLYSDAETDACSQEGNHGSDPMEIETPLLQIPDFAFLFRDLSLGCSS